MWRVYLRALEPDDYLTTINWRRDEEILKMVGGPKYFVSSEREKEWVRTAITNNERYVLGICLKENNQLIGTVNVENFDWINRSCQCPLQIGDKSKWHQGYATEAKLLALQFAFEERGMERVHEVILEDNTASLKMHLKCGFKQEGLLRHSVYKNGRFQNQYLVGILRPEFEAAFNNYLQTHHD